MPSPNENNFIEIEGRRVTETTRKVQSSGDSKTVSLPLFNKLVSGVNRVLNVEVGLDSEGVPFWLCRLVLIDPDVRGEEVDQDV